MDNQWVLDLDDALKAREMGTCTMGGRRPTVTYQFEQFHRANPHVFDELVHICRLAKSRGRKRWSIDGATEVIRWSRLKTDSLDEFKINNNYRPLYARMIMERCPDLDGFFETRERKEE